MQQFLAIHKAAIIRWWYTVLTFYFLFFLASIPLFPREWFGWGTRAASLSIIAFWIALAPGIMKRFSIAGVFLPLRTIIMLYRRQIGITMYVLAFTHYMWVRMLPILSFGGNIWRFSPFELMGISAFTLLTPVFFTSNEWSVRTLGRWWRHIHALVYIVIWLLFLHISMQGTSWQATGTLIVAVMETLSLAWKALQKPALPTVPTPPTQA